MRVTPMKDEVWSEVLQWIDYAAPTRIKRKARELHDNTINIRVDVEEWRDEFIKVCDEGADFADKVLATIKYVREHP